MKQWCHLQFAFFWFSKLISILKPQRTKDVDFEVVFYYQHLFSRCSVELVEKFPATECLKCNKFPQTIHSDVQDRFHWPYSSIFTLDVLGLSPCYMSLNLYLSFGMRITDEGSLPETCMSGPFVNFDHKK